VRRCARERGSSLGCRRGWRGRRGTQGGGGALVSDGGVGEGSVTPRVTENLNQGN
jgi:hypothetical protein